MIVKGGSTIRDVNRMRRRFFLMGLICNLYVVRLICCCYKMKIGKKRKISVMNVFKYVFIYGMI